MVRGALALVLALLGCSGEREPALARTSEPVLGGVLDDSHPSVVALRTTPDAPRATFCSATAIGPRAVLTAAHCVHNFDVATLSLTTGALARSPETTISVEQTHVAPGFTGDPNVDTAAGTDLAVVIAKSELGVPVVPLSRAAPSIGAHVTLVGYGLSSATDLETRGTRRSAEVIISGVCSLLVQFGDDVTNACHGDSGGPLLSRGTAVEELVAVVSYGRTAKCEPPTHAVRVDAYAAWIDTVLAGRTGGGPEIASDCAKDAGAADTAVADAADAAPEATAIAGAGGCATGAGGDAPSTVLLLLVALAIRRRCGGACSRS